jgi:uncharacterized protein
LSPGCSSAWAGRAFAAEPLRLPPTRPIDARLVGGSLLFGIGWGLADFCPGPALVGVGLGEAKAAGFVVAMLGGMALFEFIEFARRPAARTAPSR